MVHRSPLLQPNHGKGGVEYHATLYEAPLLPFEKQLIATIGATEEEYRLLVTEALKRSRVRPAGYEHIPDINAKAAWVTSFLISLAVGVTLSVVTYLLTPKPKQPKFKTIGGEDVNGAGRFNPTFGFDSQQEVANYSSPIPIIFANAYYENGIYQSGGCLVSPQLVWSRMFSWGTQQSIKQLWVVGEEGHRSSSDSDPKGILKPELAGIFLGNGALDAIWEDTFCFYWKKNSEGYRRIRGTNKAYGTRATPAAGDPERDDEVFGCPTINSLREPGFSSAHGLVNNAQFGCYAPVANGNLYKLNWRINNWVELEDTTDDPGDVKKWTQAKISGHKPSNSGNSSAEVGSHANRFDGQPGEGRSYSRRMGVTRLIRSDGTSVTATELERVKIVNAEKDDEIIYTIRSNDEQIDERTYMDGKVKVGDINDTVNAMREEADNALQLGEVFQIGRTYWKVIERSITQWSATANPPRAQEIRLKCIDDDDFGETNNEIGICSDMVLNPTLKKTYQGGAINISKEGTSQSLQPYAYVRDSWETTPYPGPGFFPLMRVSEATVRNTRQCEVTEIGLRSRVHQNVNGLCNFQTIPSPSTLSYYWDKKRQVSLETGVMNTYLKRASSFVIMVRPIGTNAEGTPYSWVQIPRTFVIVNGQPVDVYNWIRLTHPEKGAYEFKFRPKSGANVHRNSIDKEFIRLNGSNGNLISEDCNTTYGLFKLVTHGDKIKKKELKRNTEFTSEYSVTGTTVTVDKPDSVSIQTKTANGTTNTGETVSRVGSLEHLQFNSTPTRQGGKQAAMLWEIFGSAETGTYGVVEENGQVSVWSNETIAGKEFWLEFVAKKTHRTGHFSGETYIWELVEINVRPPGGEGYNVNEEFTVARNISSGNPFKTKDSVTITSAGSRVKVTSLVTESAHLGKSHALRYEIFGAPTNVGDEKEVTIPITSPHNLKLKVKSSVFERNDTSPAFSLGQWPGVEKSWMPETITEIVTADTSASWNVGDTVDYEKTVSAANPFRVDNSKVGYRFVIDSRTTIETGAYTEEINDDTRIFEGQSQYADLSYYHGIVQKSNESSPEHQVVYVNEMLDNQEDPTYERLTIAGLSLKASRNFSSLDQVRVWLKSGINVKKLHPDDANAIGPSNLLTDLVYYLLTDRTAGAGKTITDDQNNTDLIDTEGLITTSKFLRAEKLFFDGAITNAQNIRSFISETAPAFLCDFALVNGKFSLKPAIPYNEDTGEISDQAIEIKMIFTDGNILEDSFGVTYLGSEERRKFKAIIKYRQEALNELPKEKTLGVYFLDQAESNDQVLSEETFDLTAYCTSMEHAKKVGKFFLSIRKRITHSVSFSTTPDGLDLAPGDFIKVVTEITPYHAAYNGTIDSSGDIVSATDLADGQYSILYYKTGEEDIDTGTMTINEGSVVESDFYDSVFTVQDTTTSENIYRVEQLTLNQENIVDIVATEFPCESNLASSIAKDVLNDALFKFDTPS